MWPAAVELILISLVALFIGSLSSRFKDTRRKDSLRSPQPTVDSKTDLEQGKENATRDAATGLAGQTSKDSTKPRRDILTGVGQ